MNSYFILTFLTILSLNSLNVKSQSIVCKSEQGNLEGVCSLVDNCTGAALAGDCANKNEACCVADKASTKNGEDKWISRSLFYKIVGDTVRNKALYGYFYESMTIAKISSEYQAAAYLSQLAGETAYFRLMESTKSEKDFNKVLGNDQIGDGFRYKGRGAILLKGKSNYNDANNANLQLGYNILTNPERVAFPSLAFKIGAWFWSSNAYIVRGNATSTKGSLNELADGTFLNYAMLTNAITGNIQSLKERVILNEKILSEMKTPTMKRGEGISCQVDGVEGFAVPICLLDFKRPYCGCEGNFQKQSCPYGLTKTGICRNSEIIKCCVEKCTSAMDLVILMDSSGSIQPPNFKKEKQFVYQLVSNLDIGSNATRVAIINYSTKSEIVTDLSQTTTKESLLNKINDIPYLLGATYTATALKLANEKILTVEKGMRVLESGVSKVVVVITDGISASRTETLKQAKLIKDRGFSMISIGVGAEIDMIELIGLASTGSDQYLVQDFDAILKIIRSVSSKVCQQPAQAIPETPISAKIEKNTYKYFKLPLGNEANTRVLESNSTLKKFTIELKQLNGTSELYYSFDDENPKSKEDFLTSADDKTSDPDSDSSFIERSGFNARSLMMSNRDSGPQVERVPGSKFYNIDASTLGNATDTIYFSVKGLSDKNEFQIYVYNRTVYNSASRLDNLNLFFILNFLIFFIFFN